jgi:hypothetical protein
MSAQEGTTYGTRFIFTTSGIAIYSGTVNPEGNQIGNPGDIYILGGDYPAIYQKQWGTSTSGWSNINAVEVASPSMSVSPSASASISISVSPSISISPSRSESASPSISISPSRSESASPSISVSPSESESASPSISVSPSQSISPSISPSVSPSFGDTGYGGVQFTTDAEALVNETDVAPSSTALTTMMWVRLDTNVTTDEWRLIWELSELDSGVPTGAYWYFGVKNNYFQFYVYRASDDAEDFYDLLSAWALGDWHHIAMVTDGSNHRCYVDGSLVDTLSLALNAVPGGAGNTYERVGSEGLASTHNKFSIAEFRRWSVALTEGEVQAEMASHSLVKTANIFRHVILGNVDGTDTSGQGNDFTLVNASGMSAVTGPRGSRSPSASPSISPSSSPSEGS